MRTTTQYANYANEPATACAPSEPFLNEMLNLASDLIERASMTCDRLHRIDARVFGAPLMEQGSTCAAKAVPSGAAGELRERLTELQTILMGTSVVVDKLDNIG
jgi:hypothetical protein